MNSTIHIPQAGPLKHIVHSIWQVEGDPLFKTEHIIPKGVVEIIFDLGVSGIAQAVIGHTPQHLPPCFINGFNTIPVQLHLPGKQNYLGIRLHPVVIRQLLGAPAGIFSNQLVDLTLVSPAFHSLGHQLAEAASFKQRVNIIGNWLPAGLDSKSAQEEMLDQFLLDPYTEEHSVSSLARILCYSPRQLSRKFYGLTGMNTEDTLLYKRYLHAVHLVHTNHLSLTQVAFQSNFTDQSHFIRTFRSFAHMTPGDYRKRKGRIPGHFYQDVR
ncbi:MAG TPA: AraC family transcriptional regulator [Ferruginibacter sp.]|nr:AraC family transcriptional regulator [Ferruginibacter sp.]